MFLKKMVRVVWLWCALLFLVGVICGSVRFSSGFYTVESVHDLFEILSACATISAVILAGFSVNAWRIQIKVQSDHDLARRVAVAVLKYKQLVPVAYNDAHLCVRHCVTGFEDIPPELLKASVDSFMINMEKNLNEKTGVLAVLLEVRALWGEELPTVLVHLVSSCEVFHSCVRLFSFATNPVLTLEKRDFYKARILGLGDNFSQEGWREGNITAKINALTKYADEYIKSKLA